MPLPNHDLPAPPDPRTPRAKHRLRRRLTTGALLTAVGVLGAFALPAQAGAVTAISPTHNATAPLHPVFRWSLAPGETTWMVNIADSPATTPSGEFYSEHDVDSGFPADTATSWSPTEPLAAGVYWWQASASDADFTTHRTPPQQFHVDPVITGQKLSLAKYRYLRELDLTGTWKTNARNVLVTFSVSRNGRTLWKHSERSTSSTMSQDTAYGTWTNNHRKVKRGVKVKATMAINYGGRIARTSRTVTAP